ncbi:MAG: hypothetical protein HY287_10200 [Planctomycetes bacterium]|nr:hypothetical protein [Planctomycetota bacterium]MBI3834687.1 hypothetical protein [Planctomycetota bacterium]
MATQQIIEEESESRTPTIWDDPSVPVGDSPSLPVFPLVISAAAWTVWIGFLVTMTVHALRSRGV